MVSDITGTRRENPMPDGKSDNQLADDFANYFMTKISNIRNSLDKFENYKPVTKDVQKN